MYILNEFDLSGQHLVARVEGLIVAGGQTATIMNVTGSGVVKNFFMSIYSQNQLCRMNSILQVLIDGVLCLSVPMQDLTCSRNVEGRGGNGAAIANMHTQWFSFTSLAFNAGVGHRLSFPMGYSTSCQILIVNGSPTSSMTLGGYVEYISGGDPGVEPPRLVGTNIDQSVQPYQEGIFASYTGEGIFHGIYLLLSGGDNNYFPLEGHIKMIIDGVEMRYDSTEDYFQLPWYNWDANINRNILTDHYGCPFKNDAAIMAQYRFHLDDPIHFNENFQFSWFNGKNGISRPVNTPTAAKGVAWAYL
jgi:hypothetical protein